MAVHPGLDGACGQLRDGDTHYWTVRGQDNFNQPGPWSTPLAFRVDFRLGQRPTLLYDDLGGAAVAVA